MKYLQFYASNTDFKFIVEKALKFMIKLDKECQDDPMSCTVRPMCEKRRWLSILVKSGVPEADIPRFCYDIQVKIVNYILNKEKYFYEPEDCAIYLKDFFRLLPIASPYSLMKMLEDEEFDDLSWNIESFFRSRFSKVSCANLEESLIIFADDNLWYLDYLNRILILNINNEKILNQPMLLALLKLFNRYYKLNIKVFENTSNSWILDFRLFEIENVNIKNDDSLKAFLAEEIGNLTKISMDINFKIEEKNAHLLIPINAFCGIPESIYSTEPVTFGEIQRIYVELFKFKLKMEGWIKEYLKNHKVQEENQDNKIQLKIKVSQLQDPDK
ncbi:MAG: hypothetical protein ACTSVI_12755 [Promethearchaeota archaeon]